MVVRANVIKFNKTTSGLRTADFEEHLGLVHPRDTHSSLHGLFYVGTLSKYKRTGWKRGSRLKSLEFSM